MDMITKYEIRVGLRGSAIIEAENYSKLRYRQLRELKPVYGLKQVRDHIRELRSIDSDYWKAVPLKIVKVEHKETVLEEDA